MPIPRQIHFIWYQGQDLIPTKYQSNLESIKQYHVKWNITIWDKHSIIDFIKKNYPNHVHVYEQYPEMIQKIDVAKYFILHYYGGVYIDLDINCIKPLDDIVDNNSFVLSEMNLSTVQRYLMKSASNQKVYINNHFIACEPNHKFWITLFSKLDENKSKGKHLSHGLYIAQSTGPLFISKMLGEYDSSDIKIYPSEYFDPINCFTRYDYSTENTHIVHTSDNNWVSPGSKVIITTVSWGECYWWLWLILIIVLIAIVLFLTI